MDRVIEFRVLSSSGESYYYGTPIYNEYDLIGFWVSETETRLGIENIEPRTLSQYTGVNDSTLSRSYERDIVRDREGNLGVIQYRNGCFLINYVYSSRQLTRLNESSFLVVGNLHHNRNLLPDEY